MSSKPWENKSVSRKEGERKGQKVFFLFSEGEKTEIEYLKDLVKYEKLGAIIKFSNSKGRGATPGNLVTQALRCIKSGKTQSNTIKDEDEVWCIFDRDSHTDIGQAFVDCRNHNSSERSKKKLKIAYTHECFEHWLLLHFDLQSSALGRHGTGGLYEKIGEKLGIENYAENGKSMKIFQKIIEKGGTVENAIGFAKQIYRDAGYVSGYGQQELKDFTGDYIDFNKAPITTTHFLVLSILT